MFRRKFTWSSFLTIISFSCVMMILNRLPIHNERLKVDKPIQKVNDLETHFHKDTDVGREGLFLKKNRHQRFNRKTITDNPDASAERDCPYNITVFTPGRLGNLMFAYASMLGIAKKLKRTPVIASDNPLRLFFEISASPVDTKEVNFTEWTRFTPYYSAVYESRVNHLECSGNLLLNGYFQSWKYFADIQGTIRKEFAFKDLIRKRAMEFLEEAISRSYGNNLTRADVVVIGVHVRRSDMTDYESRQRGYVVASRQYLSAAMSFLEVQHNNVLFVVCSDDIFWVKQNVRSMGSPVVYSEDFHAILDLAVLSLSDHVIMTVGSFGWWGAYLAGGKTLYVSNFPRKHSLLSEEYRPKDYFFPGWRGLPL